MENLNKNINILENLENLKEEYPILEEQSFKYETKGDKVINKNIFYDLLGYESLENIDIEEIKNNFFNKYQEINKKLDYLENILYKKDKLNLKEEIILSNLKNSRLWLQLIFSGFEFELQKAFPEYKINEIEKEELIGNLNNLNKKLYGPKTIEQPELIKKIYFKVWNEFKKNNKKLNSYEKSAITKFLFEIGKYVDNSDKNFSFGELEQQAKKITENEIITTKSNQEFLDKKLSAQETKKIFEKVFEIYSSYFKGFDTYKVEVEQRNSISINFDNLKLKNDEYSIEHIIKLIAHEIEKHSTKFVNMKENIGKIQQSGYTEIEESMAVLFENYVLYGKEVLLSPIVPLTTAGEVFKKDKDLVNFISGYLKLIGKYKNDENTRLQRLKQFYPSNNNSVWRKGIVYSTGIEKILNDKNSDILKFFLGSFNYKTLENPEKIKEEFKNQIVKPILIAEILKYIIDNNLIDQILNGKPIMTKKLYKFLKEKYGKYINIDNEIKNFIKSRNSENIEKNTRGKLLEILQIMKKGK